MFKYAIVSENQKHANEFLERREVRLDWYPSAQKASKYHAVFLVEGALPGKVLDSVRLLKSQNVPIVVVLGRMKSSGCIFSFFEAGCDEYISYEANQKEFKARFLGIQKRLQQLDVIFCGDLEIRQQERVLFFRGKQYFLSEKEFQLLKLLVLNANEVVTRDEISKIVWRRDYDPSTNIIEVYINTLRKKIFGSVAHQFLRTIGGQGYSLEL